MEDYLVKVMTEGKDIIGAACVTMKLVNEARRMHRTYPTATAALGRALTGCELMAALLDPEQRVAIKLEGDGPLKKIIAEADGTGAVRGYVAVPEVDLPPRGGKIDVSGALGRDGFLTVSKDLRIREPYRGIVRLYTGEIASDIAYYYTESEQIPSAVGLGVFVEPGGCVSAAGGFLIQSMPTAEDKRIDTIIERIAGMDSITSQILEGRLPEDILKTIFDAIPYYVIEKRDLAFACSCSRDRIEQAIITMGKGEIRKIIADQDKVDIDCQFCGKSYVFTKSELEKLVEEMQ
jgi:molecular chaperone Hsp33